MSEQGERLPTTTRIGNGLCYCIGEFFTVYLLLVAHAFSRYLKSYIMISLSLCFALSAGDHHSRDGRGLYPYIVYNIGKYVLCSSAVNRITLAHNI